MHPTLEDIRRQAFAMLRPPPNIDLAEWIPDNVILPARAGATPGAMTLWPYQVGIAQAISDPDISRITVMKPARCGYSELLRATIFSYVANDPTNILVLTPTDKTSRPFITQLEDISAASPNLRGLISSRRGRSNFSSRFFPGGTLIFTAASTPGNLRAHTSRVVICDEIDAFKPTPEGDAISLIEVRSESYDNSKLIVGSTPTHDRGPVSIRYARSDKRVFEVPCPSCGAFSEILWADIKWDKTPDGGHLPETAYWQCPASGCVISESSKRDMIAGGQWRVTAPEVEGHAGFRLNAFCSMHPKQTWAYLVREFLDAGNRPEDLQPFFNTKLAEPWIIGDGEYLDDEALYAKRSAFRLDDLPEQVLWITGGVDVQRDRVELTLMGHCREGLVWILDHIVLIGNPEGDEVWRDLDAVLRRTWRHPLGGVIGVSATAIDSGNGEHTEIINGFTLPRRNRRIWSIKGVPGSHQLPLATSKEQKGRLLWVGVDVMKTKIFARLEAGTGFHFSDALSRTWFEQLTSEKKVVRRKNGKDVIVFEKVRGSARNESLDCLGYGWAIRNLIQQDPDERVAELSSVVAPPPKPDAGMLQTVGRSSWLTSSRERSRRW